MTKEIKNIINQLKKGIIEVDDIPEEYCNDKALLNFERKNGYRITGHRCYDVITNLFWVEEKVKFINYEGETDYRNRTRNFESFEEYSEYLDGDVLTDACYMYLPEPEKYGVESVSATSFMTETIDDFTINSDEIQGEKYHTDDEKDFITPEEAKKIHNRCLTWIDKFDRCTSAEELLKVYKSYDKSDLSDIVDVSFFFFVYIFKDLEDETRFRAIVDYASNGIYPAYKFTLELCHIYDPDRLKELFNYNLGATTTIRRHNKRFRDYANAVKENKYETIHRGYYCKNNQFYVEEYQIQRTDSFGGASIYRYFENFDEFITFRKGNLTHCDLSNAVDLAVDFSKYIIDETTKLPINLDGNCEYIIEKLYIRRKKKFCVTQTWKNSLGAEVKKYTHDFRYFFDFVHFIKGDLSNTDLLFCDGLYNLASFSGINFIDARLTSGVARYLGVNFEHKDLDTKNIESFDDFVCEEEKTALVLQDEESHLILADIKKKERNSFRGIGYVTDIHLMHRLANSKCESLNDEVYTIQNIVDPIAERGGITLIGGDLSSEVSYYKLFLDLLASTKHNYSTPVFILGNHELWEHIGQTVDEIADEYRQMINQGRGIFLHNELLFFNSRWDDSANVISYDELMELDNATIFERVRDAYIVILGGIGFAGHNEKYNANLGLYRNVLSREDEIAESEKFNALYEKILPVLRLKNAIVFTHNPITDWSGADEYENGIVYVSGHSHRNYFFDNGKRRIYADNQIGYKGKNIRIKSFLIDYGYDEFIDYEDGVYEITKEQYNSFYRGKNISMTFDRAVTKLYMLKQNGYYCFMHESKSSLTLLNGGAMKKLRYKDVYYYYERMPLMVAGISNPLKKYSELQNKVADVIKSIGGSGTIHGCIVDIDFCNHVYVNPIDLKITAYCARNIIDKVVYPSIQALLKDNCYEMYKKISALEKDKNWLLIKKNEVVELPEIYLSTDIYTISREIKKMQKLNSNILTAWYEQEDKMIGVNE